MVLKGAAASARIVGMRGSTPLERGEGAEGMAAAEMTPDGTACCTGGTSESTETTVASDKSSEVMDASHSTWIDSGLILR